MTVSEAEILYFEPFYFKNGNLSKNKYFVVRKCFEENSLLASLPTSKDFIPAKDMITEGCIELPEINQNCFLIPAHQQITLAGDFFPRDTFLYGYQIDDYATDFLDEIYPLEEIDFQRWGTMKPEIFKNLIECFKNSKTVKRKYKRLLSE